MQLCTQTVFFINYALQNIAEYMHVLCECMFCSTVYDAMLKLGTKILNRITFQFIATPRASVPAPAKPPSPAAMSVAGAAIPDEKPVVATTGRKPSKKSDHKKKKKHPPGERFIHFYAFIKSALILILN